MLHIKICLDVVIITIFWYFGAYASFRDFEKINKKPGVI